MPYVDDPVVEPISLSEAKQFIRMDADYTYEDALIGMLISANREWLEGELGLSLVPRTGLKYKFTKPCCGQCVNTYIPYGPVNEIAATYVTDDQPYELANLGADDYYPYYKLNNSVNITYSAGDWGGNFPQGLRLALLMLVATNYENRENFVVGETVNDVTQNAMTMAYKWSRNLYLS